MSSKQNSNVNLFVTSKYDRRKVLFHPRAIASVIETGDTWPVTLHTGFTTYCNHSCVWCTSAYTTRTIPSLKTSDELIIAPYIWMKNIRILAERGTKGLIIAGQGDPLLHPKAKEMLEEVTNLGMKYMIWTNGELLTEDYYDTFMDSALAVRFSVDAATPEMHERWHAAKNSQGAGTSDFALLLDNIRGLVAEKRRRGVEFPQIGCQMICSKLTEPDFEAFAKLFKEIGVDYIVYKSLQRNQSSEEHITVSSMDLHATPKERRQQARAMVKKLMDIKLRYETDDFEVYVKVDQIERAYVEKFNNAERYDRCRAHALVANIAASGNVYLCPDTNGKSEYLLGNIYEKPIDEIWESERRQEVIDSIDLINMCPAGCHLDETNVVLNEVANPNPGFHHSVI